MKIFLASYSKNQHHMNFVAVKCFVASVSVSQDLVTILPMMDTLVVLAVPGM